MDYQYTKHSLEELARNLVHANPQMVQIIYECPCGMDNKVLHHFDYFRPYMVLKLCTKCHGSEHKRLNTLIKENNNKRLGRH